MSELKRQWLISIQESLNNGFSSRADWPDIAPLLFVTSPINQGGALIVGEHVVVKGTAYSRHEMKVFSACSDDFQSSINICAKEINAYLLSEISQGLPWSVMTVAFGQVQWATWCDPERTIVDPHTGIPFEVDVNNDENHCVITRGMVVQLNQLPNSDVAFIKAKAHA